MPERKNTDSTQLLDLSADSAIGYDKGRGPSLATKALQMAQEIGVETWLDESGNPHLTVPVENHVEHYRLKTDPESQGGHWLAMHFYRREGRALPSSAKKDVLENLSAEAFTGIRVFPSSRRTARRGENVYLDLCNPSWEVVEVTPHGWTVQIGRAHV